MSKENTRAHIVFDNDGTMIDSISNFFGIIDEILPKHLGRKVTLEEAKEAYVPDWNQFFINLGVNAPSEELIQGVIDDLNKLNEGYIPPLIPGTREFIEKIQLMNMKTYVWTGRDKASAQIIFDSLKLTELFSAMEFRDTSKAKPDPAGLEVMLGGVNKEEVLLIGDSIVDVKGALAFGIKCLIVDWFDSDNHNELLEAGASAVVRSHEEALEFIQREY